MRGNDEVGVPIKRTEGFGGQASSRSVGGDACLPCYVS